MRVKHSSVSHKQIRRDLRRIKQEPKPVICDQCRWHNAVNSINPTTPNADPAKCMSTGRKSNHSRLASSLPPRTRIKLQDQSTSPGRHPDEALPKKRKKAPAVDDYNSSNSKNDRIKAKYESLNLTKKKSQVFTAQKGGELSNAKSQRSVWNQSERSPRHKTPFKTGRSKLSCTNSASVFHGQTFHKSFQIEKDLGKYTKDLNYVTTERMLTGFTNSALGRRLASLKARGKILSGLTQKWDKERDLIKNVDWAKSELYDVFLHSVQTKSHIGKMIQENAKI